MDGYCILVAGIALVVLVHLVPFLVDPHGIRSYPGPPLARFSRLWLARATLEGRVTSAVREAHEKYGTFVRISPDQVSIADPEAVHAIYAHSSGTTKSNFYDAFAIFGRARSVFSTTSREEHARKRRLMAHTLSAKALDDFVPLIYHHERLLIENWDRLCIAGEQGVSGVKGECSWTAREGRVWFDCMRWYNYKAFDIIGDLAFGASFGMLDAVTDNAQVAGSLDEALNSLKAGTSVSLECRSVPAVKTVNDANAFNTFLGCLPDWTRPLVMSLPIFRGALQARKALGTMAVTAVLARIGRQNDIVRNDFITKLLESRDIDGKPMSSDELGSESLSLLIAGSDTTANSAAAITYYLAQNRAVQMKLQDELDKAFGHPDPSLVLEDTLTEACMAKIKDCQFLLDVVNEGLRMHSTAGFGLPRLVSDGGLTVLGHAFAAGTVLSAPALTVHHLKSVWGDDADTFNPDRWAAGDRAAMQRAFAPYSLGPRACLGRNLAQMELLVFVSTVFHRYDIVLGSVGQKMAVHEGFLRKPLGVHVGVKLRRV